MGTFASRLSGSENRQTRISASSICGRVDHRARARADENMLSEIYIHFACGSHQRFELVTVLETRYLSRAAADLAYTLLLLSSYDRLAFATGGYMGFLSLLSGGNILVLEHWISLGFVWFISPIRNTAAAYGWWDFWRSRAGFCFRHDFLIARYAHTQPHQTS